MMGPVVRGVSHFSPVAATPNFQFVLQICISCGSIEDPGRLAPKELVSVFESGDRVVLPLWE